MTSGSSRLLRRFTVLAVVSLGLLGAATPAHAAVVSGTAPFVFTAAPGEVNRVAVKYPDAATVSFQDELATVTTDSAACAVITAHRVDCTDLAQPPGFRVEAGDKDDNVELGYVDQPDLCFTAEAYGGDGDDVLNAPFNVGCSGADVALHGGPGADQVRGGSLGAALYGDEGNDFLSSQRAPANLYDGGPGDDAISTGPGSDVVDGGPGTDLLTYFVRDAAVVVDLADPAGGDEEASVTGIENAEGGSGDDVLLGDGAPNELWGGAGDDVLDGRGGADLFRGGSGEDLVDYGARTAGVVADANWGPASGNAEDGPPEHRDTIADDVEGLWGTSGDDRLTAGLVAANTLVGDAGNDVLDVRNWVGYQGEPDAVSCGAGADRALTDAGDQTDADCEVREDAAPAPAPTVVPSRRQPPPFTGAPSVRDRRAPVAWLRLPAGQNLRSALRFGFTVTLSCDEACRGEADLLLDPGPAGRLGLKDAAGAIEHAQLGLQPVGSRKVSFRIHGSALRRRIRAKGQVELRISVLAQDASLNGRVITRRLVLRKDRAVLLYEAP